MIQAAHAGRGLVAAIATAAAVFGVSRASAILLPLHDAHSARLRLSWSARPERIEVCRTLSAEELAQREEHMRQRVVCNGRFASYTLRVEADDRVLDEAVVRGAGLRHDRPIYLLRDFDLAAGVHHVRVSFERREQMDGTAAAGQGGTRTERKEADTEKEEIDTGIFAGRAQREAVEYARRARAAIPPRLLLDTTLVFGSGRAIAVTFTPERRMLQLLAERPPRR